MGAKFGATEGPLLLVSVRSGARASMPGMMDTVLNLGLNDPDGAEPGEADRRRALRLRQLSAVHSNVFRRRDGRGQGEVRAPLNSTKEEVGKHYDVELTPDDWKALIQQFKNEVRKQAGRTSRKTPMSSSGAPSARCSGSWMNKRAITCRKLNNLPDHWGTAVNVQAMVFGNMGEDSATGVCFSRNRRPEKIFGEYMVARGEGVFAIRLRRSRCRWPRKTAMSMDLPAMEEVLPPLYGARYLPGIGSRSTTTTCRTWSSPSKGKLWMLQTRNGKRTAQAAADCCGDVRRGPDR